MKKFYENYFRVKEYEKIREHVMMARIFLAIAVVCVSLCSMGITAYAFFTYTVTSSSNVIKAANFSLEKTVTDEAGQSVSKKNGVYELTSDTDKSKTYQVKMTGKNVTASSGFVRIRVTYNGEKAEDHYTESIYRTDIDNGEYVIYIKVPAGRSATVQFTDNWGTCSSEQKVANGETLLSTQIDVNIPDPVKPTDTNEEGAEDGDEEGSDTGQDGTDDDAGDGSDNEAETDDNSDNMDDGADNDNQSDDSSKKEDSQGGDDQEETPDDTPGEGSSGEPEQKPVEEESVE